MNFDFNSIKQNKKSQYIGITQDKDFVIQAFYQIFPEIEDECIIKDKNILDLTDYCIDFIPSELPSDTYKKLIFELKLEPWKIIGNPIRIDCSNALAVKNLYKSKILEILGYFRSIGDLDISSVINVVSPNKEGIALMESIEKISHKCEGVEISIPAIPGITPNQIIENFGIYSQTTFIYIDKNIIKPYCPSIYSKKIIFYNGLSKGKFDFSSFRSNVEYVVSRIMNKDDANLFIRMPTKLKSEEAIRLNSFISQIKNTGLSIIDGTTIVDICLDELRGQS